MSMRKLLQRGDPMIWLTGSALGTCLLMIGGLILVIMVNGLSFFWPAPLVRLTLKDGSILLGDIVSREGIPNPGHRDHLREHRIQVRVGNRDLFGSDFRWVQESEIVARDWPHDAWLVERREYGPLIGTPVRVTEGEKVMADGAEAVAPLLGGLTAKAAQDRAVIRRIERDEIGAINSRLEKARLRARKLDLIARNEPGRDLSRERAEVERIVSAEQASYQQKQEELGRIQQAASTAAVVFRASDGQEKELRALDLYRVVPANRLGWFRRLRVYASRLWNFLADDPRESNTEGGILPAIFGTVMMVLIMSLAVVPLGIVAALYLREYAKQGPLVRTVRIAVNNLAGVPSIVFGVFGVGFFIYVLGGSLDRLFFAAALPTPTFGTGGILWASLTLALLTIPVVIVATEEGLAAVPGGAREASLALGATKLETTLRVVLPAVMPSILTGLILAMARAAGEVAPLMITGVVKLAPTLPLDGVWPFVHLERKFMHLGFHIYDVGFQSPNVDAARPMVFATTLLLLLIVVCLNLFAIGLRQRLRRTYATAAV
jgi:phosphate transport system permease protein